MRLSLAVLVAALFFGVVTPGAAQDPVQFFEERVRPVLSANCLGCHGPKMQMAGLRLDSREGMLKGTDRGQVVLVPGDPVASRLVQVVAYEGQVKMPPAGKLPAEDIEVLTAWVKMGAPWASDKADTGNERSDILERARKHWAFLPVRPPAIPSVKQKGWVQSPIDAFILAKLEVKGLRPSQPADRRTLIRRAYYDLLGFPPSAEEIDAFRADRSPNAFANLVDRLLARAEYGQRWGRHWLDIARYSDTKGYSSTRDPRYPHAYTYRDYVIRAFNADLPYDRFLIEQIAADQLPPEEDNARLAAMGFLTVGNRYKGNKHEIINDRIDVIFRGTQGLTVACARCHDHKFDPLPQKDYYSVYGVLASSREPEDLPLLAPRQQAEPYLAYEKQVRGAEREIKRILEKRQEELALELRKKIPEYLMAAHEASQPGAKVDAVARNRRLNPRFLSRWQDFLNQARKSGSAALSLWHALTDIADDEFAAKAPTVIAELSAKEFGSLANESTRPLNLLIAKAFVSPSPASLLEAAERYSKVLEEVDDRWRELLQSHLKKKAEQGEEKAGEVPQKFDDADEEELRLVLYASNSPMVVPLESIEKSLLASADRTRLQRLRSEVEELKKKAPEEPPRAMALLDAAKPVNSRVFLRGNPESLGEEAPRQFLSFFSGPDSQPFQKGSGRLELAKAIANKHNPLTARVMVNRIWLHHFGEGLVATPSDFGLQSEPGLHPELLDYLAWRFMEDQWSIKKMHRLIMLASVYQQSSRDKAKYKDIDPDNTLYWRMNRRRLDFEAMRDSLLSVSGRLDRSLGGPSVELTAQPFTGRRTVYGFIDRQELPDMFYAFDFANPESHSPQRYSTTVPQQALFAMNNAFVVSRARRVTNQLKVSGSNTPEQKIQRLYRLVYGRAASAEEVQLGLRFLKSFPAPGPAGPPRDPAAWRYGYGAYDQVTQRVKSFRPLHVFIDQGWQDGPPLLEEKGGFVGRSKTGRVILKADEGRPGNDQQRAVVRRWVAPRGGVFSIVGEIVHPQNLGRKRGDGIRARIVSSRHGLLGEWTLQAGSVRADVARVDVQHGDTIDFVVDCRVDTQQDRFLWAPVLRLIEPPAANGRGLHEWSAARDFSGPAEEEPAPLSRWDAYAQVLLLANEFMFVD